MIVILFAILLGILIFSMLAVGTRPVDSREPYLRDAKGRVWALKVGEGESHENYIHDGTPHQNPAVRYETRWRLLFFPYEIQVSYYPITINGRLLPDLDAIQARVDEGQRRGRDVELVTLDKNLERDVIRRENGTQLGRDVPSGQLAYRLNGKKR